MSASRNKTVLGAMSGTSVDGNVDVAYCRTDGEGSIERLGVTAYRYENDPSRPVHHFTKAAELAFVAARGDLQAARAAYESAVKEYFAHTFSSLGAQVTSKIAELASAFHNRSGSSTVSLDDVIHKSTQVHIEAYQAAMKTFGITSKDVDLIGYHGQTLYHAPFNRISIQVGEPQVVARILKTPVVADFRSNDICHGGQGAPLAPVYHRALIKSGGFDSGVVVNLGGTANISVVRPGEEGFFGFDTGPANGLIDRYVKERLGLEHDEDSNIALKGKVHEVVLQELLANAIRLEDGRNFLEIAPPKSLDIRDYSSDFPLFNRLSVEDGCATLNAFTAECIARGAAWLEKRKISAPVLWVLCGGGTKNRHLRNELQARLASIVGPQLNIKTADELGWSSQGLEAELIGYLAVRSIYGLPITFPETTGVKAPLSGGNLYNPA